MRPLNIKKLTDKIDASYTKLYESNCSLCTLTKEKYMFGTSSSSSSGKIIDKANKFLEKGKHERAVQVFQDSLTKDPKNHDLLLGLAEVYCRIQEIQSAIREYRKAFKLNPDKSREILVVLESPPGGAKVEDFFELRVEILIHHRGLESAMKLLDKAHESGLSRIVERNGTRIAELRKISSSGQNALLIAELGYFMGLILEHQHAYKKAFIAYTSILRIREEEMLHILPRLEIVVSHIRDDAQPFIYMGDLIKTSDPEKAVNYFHKAMDLDLTTAPSIVERFQDSASGVEDHWLLGRACILSEEWSKGVSCLQEIEDDRLKPRMIELLQGVDLSLSGAEPARLFLADLYFSSGNSSEASKTYTSLTGKMDADLLRQRFQRLVDADPDNINAARALGELCLDEGDLDNSLAQMRRIVQTDLSQADVLFEKAFPLLETHFEDPELPLFLAELCQGHSEVERPLVLLRRFVQLNPSGADRAIVIIQELIQKYPAHPQLRMTEAEALLALEHYRDSFQAFQIALSLDQTLIPETLHHLSLLLHRSPELSSDVRSFFSELETRGPIEPAVQLVWAEAALTGGEYQEAADRSILCALAVPDKADIVEGLLREWSDTYPDCAELRLGLADLFFRTERFEDVTGVFDHYLREHPRAAGKVITAFKKMIQKCPGNLTLYQGMLTTYLLGGTFDLVLEEGKKLEKVFQPPHIALIHRIMGDACRQMGRFSDAVSLYYQTFKEDTSEAETIAQKLEQVLAMNPSLPKASLALGTVLSACGRVDEAVECLLRLVRELPKSRETIMKYLMHVSEEHPMEIDPILGMAELHILDGRYETSLELLWKGIQRDDQNSDAILRLLTQIAEKNPGMARVQLEMGKVYLNLGLHAKAAEHFVQSVEMDHALSEQGIKFCHDILDADKTEIAAYLAISRILVCMKRHVAAASFLSASGEASPEIREALLPQMEEIVAMAPDSPEALKNLAWTYLNVGKMNSSVRTMRKACALDPSCIKEGVRLFSEVISQDSAHVEARMARGRCRLNTLDLQGAFEDIQLAVQTDPEQIDAGIDLLEGLKQKGWDTVEFYLFIGELYSRKETYQLGIKVLQEGLQTVTDEQARLQLMIQLAGHHEKMGDMDTAQDILEAAKELSDDQTFYYAKLNEFAIQRILFETRAYEQESARGGLPSTEKFRRFISHLVLLGREEEADQWVREKAGSWDPDEGREIWGHYYEEIGNYTLAAQCCNKDDLCQRIHLLEKAGESLLAASLLEEAVKQNPDSVLHEHLKDSCTALMEESILQEKFPLMGETRLKITA
jgi:tetratricopeptide (TPR) repeat protein